MRDDTTSRQTGQFAYFAAQPPQRMWPQGTRAVGLSFGSRHIGHSSASRAGAVGGGAAGTAAGAGRGAAAAGVRQPSSPRRLVSAPGSLQSSGGFRVAEADVTLSMRMKRRCSLRWLAG